MKHSNKIIDTDNRFEIDPITRTIKNMSPTKTTIMQFDHKSERFTFCLPRMVEGHDMMECNKVEIHFTNMDANTREQNFGIYTVEDLAVDVTGEGKVVFSWLVEHDATQKAGTLAFLIRFSCVAEDDTIEYAWNTAIFSGISVSAGMHNTEIVVSPYLDDFTAEMKAWLEEVILGGEW